jgi:prepilin peptidase CpaA
VPAGYALRLVRGTAQAKPPIVPRRRKSMLRAILLSLVAAVFPGLMALSASTDLMTMTIPNAIPLALALGYLALAAALGVPPETVALGLSCGLAMLAAAFFLFWRNWIGGGDAKLAAAIALWLGWGAIADFALSASICGGLLTLGILALRMQPLPEALARRAFIARLTCPGAGVPYGVALAVAGLIQFPRSPVWLAAVA